MAVAKSNTVSASQDANQKKQEPQNTYNMIPEFKVPLLFMCAQKRQKKKK